MTTYEIRLRGNNPKFIDIMTKGAADSSGAVARIPLHDLNALPKSGHACASAAAANTPPLETPDGGDEWPKP